MPPGRFIPAAEENGLIVEIGNWVLFEACRQMAAWRAQGLEIPRIAVNVAAAQLHKGELEGVVRDALAKTGLPASALELELTESSLVENDSGVMQTLSRLKALGVKLSIDDFGTGYSCLSYLRQLAVDMLKIDRSFVQGIDTEDGHAIVATISRWPTRWGSRPWLKVSRSRPSPMSCCGSAAGRRRVSSMRARFRPRS